MAGNMLAELLVLSAARIRDIFENNTRRMTALYSHRFHMFIDIE